MKIIVISKDGLTLLECDWSKRELQKHKYHITPKNKNSELYFYITGNYLISRITNTATLY